ncbi:MAG: hypothetical protein GX323_06940 [Clostridiales bacterium]|nr:hypothetical protein [Clostridiales bacterium]
MKRRYLLKIFSIIFILGLLVGCSNANGQKDDGQDKEIDKEHTIGVKKDDDSSKLGVMSEPNSEEEVKKFDIGKLEKTKHTELNILDGVTMEVKEGSISPSGLTIVFTNTLDKEFIYGQYFLIETKIDGDWYELPLIIDNYGFDDIGYILSPNGQSEWNTDWEWLYGSLANGEYRIIKDIIDSKEPGDYDVFYMAAEFVIENQN